MPDRKIVVDHWECLQCGQPIEVQILTHEDEEAPNLYCVPAGCFLTCMVVDDDEDMESDEEEYVVFCNAKCARKMLEDYDAPPDRETDPESLPQ
jgi:hypothetical protein